MSSYTCTTRKASDRVLKCTTRRSASSVERSLHGPHELMTPSHALALVAAALGTAVYCDPRLLDGRFVYDDRGSVEKNPMVHTEQSKWEDLWQHDFWGEELRSKHS